MAARWPSSPSPPDVRLRLDGSNQRSFRRPIPGGLPERSAEIYTPLHRSPGKRHIRRFRNPCDALFLVENIKGIPESSEKALRIMQFTTVMVVLLIGWCCYTAWVRGSHLPPLPPLPTCISPRRPGVAKAQHLPHTIGCWNLYRPRTLDPGHERRGITRPGLSRNSASQTAEFEEGRVGHLHLQHDLHLAVSFFAVMIIPDAVRKNFFDNLIGGLAMNMAVP